MTPDWNKLGRRWWSRVEVLAADDKEGRGTGSRGFEKAADYMIEQFRAAGLQPAGGNGYRQPVDFRVTQIYQDRCSLELIRGRDVQHVKLGDAAVIAGTSETVDAVEAEAVFVGYGLTVPELDYDDLAALDLKGKIGVYVQGGPANIPGPVKAHYQSLAERTKFLRKAGVIGVVGMPNPTVPELPWSRLASMYLMPSMELRDPGRDVAAPLPMSIVFNPERAEMLFEGSGHTFQEVVAVLGSDGPLPRFPLAVKVRARVALARREASCQNLIGVLPGKDPALKNEYVVVSAHLDHLGVGEPVDGDPIYSGAMDNASGAATLLEVASAMKESGAQPTRSILFLAVTGEEMGLLGSQYFATHPTVAGPIVANLNLDGFLPLFPLKYLEVQGLSESSLGEDIRAVARESGVEVHDAYEPDRVLFIRSDQYNFIKEGVPSLFPTFGYLRGSPEEKLVKGWLRQRYHAPADDANQPVDLAAAAQFNSLFGNLALRVANAADRPSWNAGSFFSRFVH